MPQVSGGNQVASPEWRQYYRVRSGSGRWFARPEGRKTLSREAERIRGKMAVPKKADLKKSILKALRKQGYRVRGGAIRIPKDSSKDDFRRMNELAVAKKLGESGPHIKRYEDGLLDYIADGSQVRPTRVSPKVVLVKADSPEELLFRYAYLHWSIPISAGYGRRLRFLVMDESNNKLIGILGLGDPVYAMQARDRWIGWDRDVKKDRLYHVMDAFVLGAIPPYS